MHMPYNSNFKVAPRTHLCSVKNYNKTKRMQVTKTSATLRKRGSTALQILTAFAFLNDNGSKFNTQLFVLIQTAFYCSSAPRRY
jgi:hypothetical protein